MVSQPSQPRRFARQLMRPDWAVVIFVAVWVIYFAVLHPWLMNWGATPAEQQMILPGDASTGGVRTSANWFTRAITIHAPASVVWQWIVQIGEDRAGFYSNTWLENLTGADIHNADTLHPEWQHRALGDRIPLARPDLFGSLFAHGAETRIEMLQPERLIAYIPTRFVLHPIDAQTTRLLLRERVPSTFAGRALNALVWDAMHFVMQLRMLRGIKERAEGQPLVTRGLRLGARIGWIMAGIGLTALFLARRPAWILPPVLIVLPVLWLTRDWDAALAGFLALGITLLGALEFGRLWWPPYLLIATAVAILLLLPPDPYTAFGITFDVVLGLFLANYTRGFRTRINSHPAP